MRNFIYPELAHSCNENPALLTSDVSTGQGLLRADHAAHGAGIPPAAVVHGQY